MKTLDYLHGFYQFSKHEETLICVHGGGVWRWVRKKLSAFGLFEVF